MFEILRTNTETDIDEDFVAVANCIGSKHAFIVFYLDQIKYVIHYDSHNIELTQDQEHIYDTFHKKIIQIQQELVPAFKTFCDMVLEQAKPQYGYFYSGESYQILDGSFVANNPFVNQHMTCVGFCLCLLKGFLEVDYINYEDWDNSPDIELTDYLTYFCEKNGFDIENVIESHRRIYPIELLASAFFQKMPISKSDISTVLPIVKSCMDTFNSKYGPNNSTT